MSFTSKREFKADGEASSMSNGNGTSDGKKRRVLSGEERMQVGAACTLLSMPLGPEYIRSRKAHGNTEVSYLSTGDAIDIANRIFGPNNWKDGVKECSRTISREGGRHVVVAECIVTVTWLTPDPWVCHEDIGTGTGENARLSQAMDVALKAAVSDALKRALRKFGFALGNCLYDPAYRSFVEGIRAQEKAVHPSLRWDRTKLLRKPKLETMDTTDNLLESVEDDFVEDCGRVIPINTFNKSSTILRPHTEMTALPTVYQFPSFVETVGLVENEAHQCIWYLPNMKRRCQVPITAVEDERKAAELARRFWESGPSVASALVILAEIAELTCCGPYHRNKIYGSGLAQELANRWLNETNPNPGVKTECGKVALPAVEFARREVRKGESLRSLLCSDIRPDAPATGSIYFYTHAGDAFSGMVKIGYTSRRIESRLDEWGECGYGYPELLGFYREVRHPERVEHLTQFELVECWHALRWCKPCGKSHQEWFKVNIERALAIASQWSRWIRDADPYDRRGHLKRRWKGYIEFLNEHGIPITANAMLQIHEIEIGLVGVNEFVDDTALRSTLGVRVKKEEDRTGC